jgi:hypothetical protein
MIDVSKLKISAIDDDKPVTITIKLPAAVHRDLEAYAGALGRSDGRPIDPISLVTPMLIQFMAGDRVFRKIRRQLTPGKTT